MLNNRQEKILAAVISEYVETAQPVASRAIVEGYGLRVSPATVRNDMADLEQQGFLRQPHTSSGRVPTEEGYRYFLSRFVKPDTHTLPHQSLTNAVARHDDHKEMMREIARMLVTLSGETAVTSLQGWNYYTGIARLFEKPEFNNIEMLQALGGIVDQFDEIVQQSFSRMDKDVNIWLGGENPFGKEMSTIVVRYKMPGGVTGILGLVGPLRMDYERNIHLLSQAKQLLDNTEL